MVMGMKIVWYFRWSRRQDERTCSTNFFFFSTQQSTGKKERSQQEVEEGRGERGEETARRGGAEWRLWFHRAPRRKRKIAMMRRITCLVPLALFLPASILLLNLSVFMHKCQSDSVWNSSLLFKQKVSKTRWMSDSIVAPSQTMLACLL